MTNYTTDLRNKIGLEIQRLRKLRHLTGDELGQLVGLSQSRIAKIENGYPPFRSKEVETLLDVLGASKSSRQHVQHLITQLDPSDTPNKQHTYIYPFRPSQAEKYESQATHIRMFVLNGMPVALQTAAYRRSLLLQHGMSPAQAEADMQRTLRRQDLLWRADKHFTFLIHETALYTLVTSLNEHLEQLDRLERMINLMRDKIGIVPMRTGLLVAAASPFAIYDETRLWYELSSSEVETHNAASIAQNLTIFDELASRAHFGQEAVVYIRQAVDYLIQ